MQPVRIAVLGAARILPAALLRPAATLREVTVTAVAARDPARAEALARRYAIPRVHRRYDDVLADPDVDAVYIPLPNSLHGTWAIRALERGKHVLCEKPLAANAEEATHVAQAAERSGQVLMEAFHYRYHPLAERMQAIVTGGTLGRIRHIEVWICFPVLRFGDIRYRYALGGGAVMDAGCYGIHMIRFLSGAEPAVIQARSWLSGRSVDRRTEARFLLPGGATASMTCSLLSRTLLKLALRVTGERGEMAVANPLHPSLYHRLTIRTSVGTQVEHLPAVSTYTCQLQAFARAVAEGYPVPTGPADAVANMRVIDEVYRRAGLPPRVASEPALDR